MVSKFKSSRNTVSTLIIPKKKGIYSLDRINHFVVSSYEKSKAFDSTSHSTVSYKLG